MNLCPCKECRPPNMTFREALRRATRVELINRLGLEAYERRESDKRARFAMLRERKAVAK